MSLLARLVVDVFQSLLGFPPQHGEHSFPNSVNRDYVFQKRIIQRWQLKHMCRENYDITVNYSLYFEIVMYFMSLYHTVSAQISQLSLLNIAVHS